MLLRQQLNLPLKIPSSVEACVQKFCNVLDQDNETFDQFTNVSELLHYQMLSTKSSRTFKTDVQAFSDELKTFASDLTTKSKCDGHQLSVNFVEYVTQWKRNMIEKSQQLSQHHMAWTVLKLRAVTSRGLVTAAEKGTCAIVIKPCQGIKGALERHEQVTIVSDSNNNVGCLLVKNKMGQEYEVPRINLVKSEMDSTNKKVLLKVQSELQNNVQKVSKQFEEQFWNFIVVYLETLSSNDLIFFESADSWNQIINLIKQFDLSTSKQALSLINIVNTNVVKKDLPTASRVLSRETNLIQDIINVFLGIRTCIDEFVIAADNVQEQIDPTWITWALKFCETHTMNNVNGVLNSESFSKKFSSQFLETNSSQQLEKQFYSGSRKSSFNSLSSFEVSSNKEIKTTLTTITKTETIDRTSKLLAMNAEEARKRTDKWIDSTSSYLMKTVNQPIKVHQPTAVINNYSQGKTTTDSEFTDIKIKQKQSQKNVLLDFDDTDWKPSKKFVSLHCQSDQFDNTNFEKNQHTTTGGFKQTTTVLETKKSDSYKQSNKSLTSITLQSKSGKPKQSSAVVESGAKWELENVNFECQTDMITTSLVTKEENKLLKTQQYEKMKLTNRQKKVTDSSAEWTQTKLNSQCQTDRTNISITSAFYERGSTDQIIRVKQTVECTGSYKEINLEKANIHCQPKILIESTQEFRETKCTSTNMAFKQKISVADNGIFEEIVSTSSNIKFKPDQSIESTTAYRDLKFIDSNIVYKTNIPMSNTGTYRELDSKSANIQFNLEKPIAHTQTYKEVLYDLSSVFYKEKRSVDFTQAERELAVNCSNVRFNQVITQTGMYKEILSTSSNIKFKVDQPMEKTTAYRDLQFLDSNIAFKINIPMSNTGTYKELDSKSANIQFNLEKPIAHTQTYKEVLYDLSSVFYKEKRSVDSTQAERELAVNCSNVRFNQVITQTESWKETEAILSNIKCSQSLEETGSYDEINYETNGIYCKEQRLVENTEIAREIDVNVSNVAYKHSAEIDASGLSKELTYELANVSIRAHIESYGISRDLEHEDADTKTLMVPLVDNGVFRINDFSEASVHSTNILSECGTFYSSQTRSIKSQSNIRVPQVDCAVGGNLAPQCYDNSQQTFTKEEKSTVENGCFGVFQVLHATSSRGTDMTEYIVMCDTGACATTKKIEYEEEKPIIPERHKVVERSHLVESGAEGNMRIGVRRRQTDRFFERKRHKSAGSREASLLEKSIRSLLVSTEQDPDIEIVTKTKSKEESSLHANWRYPVQRTDFRPTDDSMTRPSLIIYETDKYCREYMPIEDYEQNNFKRAYTYATMPRNKIVERRNVNNFNQSFNEHHSNCLIDNSRDIGKSSNINYEQNYYVSAPSTHIATQVTEMSNGGYAEVFEQQGTFNDDSLCIEQRTVSAPATEIVHETWHETVVVPSSSQVNVVQQVQETCIDENVNEFTQQKTQILPQQQKWSSETRRYGEKRDMTQSEDVIIVEQRTMSTPRLVENVDKKITNKYTKSMPLLVDEKQTIHLEHAVSVPMSSERSTDRVDYHINSGLARSSDSYSRQQQHQSSFSSKTSSSKKGFSSRVHQTVQESRHKKRSTDL